MKNRILIPLLVLLALITITTASADTYALYGDGATTTCFYVESYGDAKIWLTQTEGLCHELSYTHLIDGLEGDEEEWGKYHFYISAPNGAQSVWDWDKTFHGQDFTLTLSGTGIYTIRVVPFIGSEMTQSWTLDQFIGWTVLPQWRITSWQNCAVSEKSFRQYSGTVEIRCYHENGNLIDTRVLTIISSQTIKPPTLNGYYPTTTGQYVALDPSTGKCSPSTVSFRYKSANQSSHKPPLGGTGGSHSTIQKLPHRAYSVWLRDPYVERIQPQCGPDYNYSVFASMSGSKKLYKPSDITYMSAHFRVGNWLYVEFGYTDGVLRYGFFERSLFDSNDWSSIPSYSLNQETPGYIVSKVTPYNGPSSNCGSYSSCSLNPGADVYACMESNGWYLCRFYNDHGNNYGDVYLWVPGDSIAWY